MTQFARRPRQDSFLPGSFEFSRGRSCRAGRRQKRPECRQHFLKRLPEPHGHGSLRPSFSSSSFSPCTIRSPRLTCVSDGNPRRRLLIVSKQRPVFAVSMLSHDAPPSCGLSNNPRTDGVERRFARRSLAVGEDQLQVRHRVLDLKRVFVAVGMSEDFSGLVFGRDDRCFDGPVDLQFRAVPDDGSF